MGVFALLGELVKATVQTKPFDIRRERQGISLVFPR